MTWGTPRSFPRAILHIDGDSFFASCEIAKDPTLRGKPVITGKERGIVSACTYEVRRTGVKTGMKLHEALKLCPDAIVLPSDYETYSIFSERMYAIVRRYTSAVEEYSIDECFADLTGWRRAHGMSYPEIAATIQRELNTELGMTFSIGVSATKVLAKLGSKWKKPHGLTVIPLSEAEMFLAGTPVGSLWGIGHNTAGYLNTLGVYTALEFAHKEESWIKNHLTKPSYEIWQEINGTVVYELDTKGRESYQSISKTKTFTPPSTDASFIYSQLSKNVENACIKARRWDLSTPKIFFFLKTQEFKYRGCEVTLPYVTSSPLDILREIQKQFPRVYRPRERYRATGITLLKLSQDAHTQLDLFGAVQESQAVHEVFKSVDEISERYGKHAVFLGSSFKAMKFGAHLGERGDTPRRTTQLFKGETARRRLPIPLLGEVS